jgi:hypothetical protein
MQASDAAIQPVSRHALPRHRLPGYFVVCCAIALGGGAGVRLAGRRADAPDLQDRDLKGMARSATSLLAPCNKCRRDAIDMAASYLPAYRGQRADCAHPAIRLC